MTYTANSLVEAIDYNTFATLTNSVNSVWATGTGIRGYGQTALPTVNTSTYVTSAQWTDMVDALNNINRHINNTPTALGNAQVAVGQQILILNGAPAVLTNAVSNAQNDTLNCATQGATGATTFSNTTSWRDFLTFTVSISFGNANQLRWFFNAGGQFSFSAAHGATGGINDLIAPLCTGMGTIWLSSQNNVTLAGTTWTGTQRIGGSGGTVNTGIGFHNLGGAATNLYTATSGSGSFGGRYAGTNIALRASISGGTLTITLTIDEAWTGGVGPQVGLVVGTPTTFTVTTRAPETTNITNSWGGISITNAFSRA